MPTGGVLRIRVYSRSTWSTDSDRPELVLTLHGRRPADYLPDVRERVVDAIKGAGLRASGFEDSEGGVVFYVLHGEWRTGSNRIVQLIRGEFPQT